MTPDQEKLLREMASGTVDGVLASPTGQALAQVVLELAAKAENPLRVVDLTVPTGDGPLLRQLVDCAAEHPALKLADWSEGVRECYARALVLDLLSVLDCDPGEAVAEGCVSHAATAKLCYRGIIQAIRRGE